MSRTLDMRGKTITTYIAYHATEALQHMDEGDLLEISTDDAEAIETTFGHGAGRPGTTSGWPRRSFSATT